MNERSEIPDQTDLDPQGGIEKRVHLFDDDSRQAILAALGASRPLLVRGEPGGGKTQLAEAVAKVWNRTFLSYVVDSRTETRDLLYSFDAVRRLAEAQLCAALQVANEDDAKQVRRRVRSQRFLAPGPLWWAFDWQSAWRQAQLSQTHAPYAKSTWQANKGVVLLIDEIDKAETDVPNGLLDALGARKFHPAGIRKPVELKGQPPLIVITTNEERALPDPFLRRCVVLNLDLPGKFEPDGSNKPLLDWLVARGKSHFPDTDPGVVEKAAKLLITDRYEASKKKWSPLPGQAEYLDLLRAVVELEPGKKNVQKQLDLLEKIRKFVLRKHRVAP